MNTKAFYSRFILAVILLSVINGFIGCKEKVAAHKQTLNHESQPAKDTAKELIVFHAGSLSLPFKQLAKIFEEKHPNVKVLSEAAGSRDTARKVSDLKRPCDVLASADYKVVDNLLMPDHAEFNIRFATNEMAIAYHKKSRYSDQITSKNWPKFLLKKDVAFGRADPNSDPCGYRSVMVFQLAEKYFKKPGLAASLANKDGKKYIRPKETDLLALLEVGEIDYLFIYQSVASQHDLKTIALGDDMNLRSDKNEALYATASVQVTGKKPGELITRKGAPIVYSVTIPKAAPHKALAKEFLELLLSEKGRAVMAANGQNPVVPAISKEIKALPASIKKYCTGTGK